VVRTTRERRVWTVPSSTPDLFFLVAWFVAAALSAPLVDSFVQVVSLIQHE